MNIKISLGQFNTVLLYENLNPKLIPTDDIKSRISTIYGIDTQIVLTEFPDIMALLIPQHQISLIAENKRIQISNGGTGDITGRELENFSKLIISIKEIMQQKQPEMHFKAYGFNYDLLLELQDCDYNAGELLKRKFMRSLTQIERNLGGSIESASPGISIRTEHERFDLRFDPILQPDLTPSNKINGLCNVHMLDNTLPTDYSEIQRQLSESFTKISTNIQRLLTV